MRFAFPKAFAGIALLAALIGTAASASVKARDVCDTSVVSRLSAGPLVITKPSTAGPSDAFVVLYSGDGGWAKADCEFTRGFAERGLPVVGVNSVRYFNRKRTPQRAGADPARWIETYSARFGRPKVILMGYSFGASALPIIAENLPDQTRARVKEVALAGPGSGAELVLRPRSWFNHLAPDALPVEPALANIRDLHVLCVYGDEDHHAACPSFPAGEVTVRTVPGTHRFRGAYDQVVRAVTG